ncbi:MAG: hypothetical protein PHV68_10060 [Candidatus Gastranaerophilales bacterium]|nr:hypothetical protein [Candidatus Gastranaerophilales bacterium]
MNHSDGFEKEEKFFELFVMARQDCPTLKTRTFKKILAELNPEFMANLFEIRPCVRKLRYRDRSREERAIEDRGFFKVGGIYTSVNFTGATYSIEGYGDNKIGSGYFDIVEE